MTLEKAIDILIKQYEHSKQSSFVRKPVAHALYKTWKIVDEKERERKLTENL